MINLQVAKVTSAAKVIKAGPVGYYGFIAHKNGSQSGVTLTISDSAASTTTGSVILDHCAIVSGCSTHKPAYYNTVNTLGRRCASGLRVQCVSFAAGVTISIFWK